MKNLTTFIDPLKKFNKEHEELTKIQIDNSLELGWKPEDILLVTNFPYEYRGVKAYLVGDDCFYGKNNFIRSTKIPVINRLYENGDVKELIWFHDNDAFQMEPFDEERIRLEMDGMCMGITSHGWTRKWNAGSFFFDEKARDIFIKTRECMDERNLDEQDALQHLIDNNLVGNIKNLNLTYNFGIYYHIYTYKRVAKPLMVAHFHPHKPRHLKLYTPLITKRFINLLKNYGLESID